MNNMYKERYPPSPTKVCIISLEGSFYRRGQKTSSLLGSSNEPLLKQHLCIIQVRDGVPLLLRKLWSQADSLGATADIYCIFVFFFPSGDTVSPTAALALLEYDSVGFSRVIYQPRPSRGNACLIGAGMQL